MAILRHTDSLRIHLKINRKANIIKASKLNIPRILTIFNKVDIPGSLTAGQTPDIEETSSINMPTVDFLPPVHNNMPIHPLPSARVLLISRICNGQPLPAVAAGPLH